MPFMLPQPVRAETAPYVFFDKIFSDEECARIVELAKSLPQSKAQVGGGDSGAVVAEKRRTEVSWAEWSPETDWIYKKLSDAVASSNAKWWGFHLAGFMEPIQLTHYLGQDEGFYDWHEDHGDSGAFLHRKLSIVVLLNDEFEGGDFELFNLGKPKEMGKGTAIIFPSYKVHRVTPVTKGDRWSLVSWITGPMFV